MGIFVWTTWRACVCRSNLWETEGKGGASWGGRPGPDSTAGSAAGTAPGQLFCSEVSVPRCCIPRQLLVAVGHLPREAVTSRECPGEWASRSHSPGSRISSEWLVANTHTAGGRVDLTRETHLGGHGGSCDRRTFEDSMSQGGPWAFHSMSTVFLWRHLLGAWRPQAAALPACFLSSLFATLRSDCPRSWGELTLFSTRQVSFSFLMQCAGDRAGRVTPVLLSVRIWDAFLPISWEVILKSRCFAMALRNPKFLQLQRKSKVLRNRFNQGGTRPVLGKL